MMMPILSIVMKMRLVVYFLFYGIIDNNTLPLIPISDLLRKSDFVFVEFIYVGVIIFMIYNRLTTCCIVTTVQSLLRKTKTG